MEDLFSPEFWALVQSAQNRGQRRGQAIFNIAYEMFPDIVRELNTTQYDPFHRDERISEFLEELVNRLTEKDSQ